MNKAKQKHRGINHLSPGCFFYQQNVNGGKKNGNRYKKLDQWLIHAQPAQSGQHQCKRMTNGKCSNQNGQFFPVGKTVTSRHSQQKNQMVESRQVGYMMESQLTICAKQIRKKFKLANIRLAMRIKKQKSTSGCKDREQNLVIFDFPKPTECFQKKPNMPLRHYNT